MDATTLRNENGSSSTATIKGLTSQEAAEKLQEFGPNDPAPPRRGLAVLDLLRLFLNPLVLVLLLAATISGFLGNATSAGIIIAIVLLSVGIDFAQTYRSNQAIKQLRQRVAPTATALSGRRAARFVPTLKPARRTST